MSLLFYDGGLSACRSMLREAGGTEVSFPKGVDIFPYLKRNNLCLFIDEGYLDARLMTPGVGIYEPVSYTAGSLLIGEVFWGQEFSLTHFELIPSVRQMQGLCLPRKTLMERCSCSNELWTKLFQMFKEISYIHSVNTVLFHAGKGTSRVCNYLWVYDLLQRRNGNLPPITQERIACKTLLSQSQVTRVMNYLREAGIVDTSYRNIEILDRKRMGEFLSPLCQDASFLTTIT